MNNCSNLIEKASLEIINYCKNECRHSLINKCYCKCFENYTDIINDDYVFYENTIISYIFFTLLLFMCCLINLCCFTIYRKRLLNSIQYIDDDCENNYDYGNSESPEYKNLINKQPPAYDAITIDLD